ncbi:hypothetical protein [Ruminococcus sp. HUN007]|uniref:hypothetical protein n=1 Tax=Ruminococcus sp. HUN007 TaxID=1514668 RepID=UPI0005D1B06B|nr:hypothetical protein [Ruminococcus sp. HUN007]
MEYNTMYDVYMDLCTRFPELQPAYDNTRDSVSVSAGNYQVTAYSNYDKAVLMISDPFTDPSAQYKLDLGSFGDAAKFLSDFITGVVQFTQTHFGKKKRLKIDGWDSIKTEVKKEVTGKLAMAAGIISMAIGGLVTAAGTLISFDDGFDAEDLMVIQMFLGLFIFGLYLVTHSSKVKFADALGYFAGVSVTTIPVAVVLESLHEKEIAWPVAALLSAAFFAIGHIVRKSFVKKIDTNDDVYLECLPGPVYPGNGQNMQ